MRWMKVRNRTCIVQGRRRSRNIVALVPRGGIEAPTLEFNPQRTCHQSDEAIPRPTMSWVLNSRSRELDKRRTSSLVKKCGVKCGASIRSFLFLSMNQILDAYAGGESVRLRLTQ